MGLAEDAFVVASEPYGIVEETASYLRMDGETPANPENPNASRGQIAVARRPGSGHPGGRHPARYDGTALPVDAGEVVRAEITTRDIDRGHYPHYLLKEISEAPGLVPQDPAGSPDRPSRGHRRSRRATGGAPDSALPDRPAGPPALPARCAGSW